MRTATLCLLGWVAACGGEAANATTADTETGGTTSSGTTLATAATTLDGPVCGNGVVELGEDCDDGQNGDNNDGCNDLCTLPGCGDGFVQPPEHCDDGNDDPADGCTELCEGSHAPAWTVTRSGDGDSLDGAGAVAVDAAGNVFVVGSLWTGMERLDIWTAKYSSDGQELWSQLYDGPNVASIDRGFDVAVDDQGAAVVVGVEVTGGGLSEGAFIRKLASDGTEQWTVVENVPDVSSPDHARAVAIDGQGNVIVGGFLGNPAWVAKYDSAGGEIWSQTFGGMGGFDAVDELAIDGEDNILVAGSLGDDVWLEKLSPAGDSQWVVSFHTVKDIFDAGTALAVDADQNVYLGGSSAHSWVRKYDPAGTELWTAVYGGENTNVVSLAASSTGEVFLLGSEPPTETGRRAWVRRLDAQGGVIWKQDYAGPAGVAWASGVALAQDGSFVAVGGARQTLSDDDVWIRRWSAP